MIIGGISLYRSFAMYEEKASFDVLKGTVPDFSTKDITLAFTIDGKTDTNKNFPNKGEGYIVETVECEDGVVATWNNSTWSLENIENKETAKKVKCTVKFKTSKGEPILNGADPVLGEGMIPVKIEDKGVVKKVTPESGEWYSYENKEWANAVILNEGAEEPGEGEQIEESEIESYFVWIPKYKYRLFNLGNYTSLTGIDPNREQRIEIEFGLNNTKDGKYECETPMLENKVQGASGVTGNCQVGNWMTHPAFLAFGGNGLWIGKFEASNNEGIKVKPNVSSWRGLTLVIPFENSKNYKPKLLSHMMKNTEWGAVAYLTQSIYGRCDKNTNKCTEVSLNTHSGFVTGCTGNTTYGGSNDQLASTTGNYSGIYDMSGGAWEHQASVMLSEDNETPFYGVSGLDSTKIGDKKYYDVYKYGTDYTKFERRILGDATGEIGPFVSSNSNVISSIYGDGASLCVKASPWLSRGGLNNMGSLAGVFTVSRAAGAADSNSSFRVALAPEV